MGEALLRRLAQPSLQLHRAARRHHHHRGPHHGPRRHRSPGVDLASPENQAAFYITYYLLGAFFFFQASSLAAGITGGASLGAGEFAAAALGSAGLVIRSVRLRSARGGGGGSGRAPRTGGSMRAT